MSNKQYPTYSTAKTPSEIIAAVARAAWWKEHGSAKCPPHKVPNEIDLRDFVIKENQRVEVLKEVEHPPRTNPPWPTNPQAPLSDLDLSKYPWRLQVGKLVECALGHSCRNVSLEATSNVPGASPDVFGDMMILVWVKQLPAALELDTSRNAYPDELGMLLLSISGLHDRLQALPKDLRPPQHPLEPLVKAWQERPTRVERNTRKDRTIPSRLGMVNSSNNRAGKLFNPAMYLGKTQDGGQLVMPGFAEYFQDLPTPALPLVLYDLGIEQEVRQGGEGAPLALRIWVESILSVGIDDRRLNQPVVFETPLGKFLEEAWPGDRPRPSVWVPRLEDLSEVLASRKAKIPYRDPGTGIDYARNIVMLNDFPRKGGRRELKDGMVRRIVDLPPGAINGPIVSPRLRFWGLVRAAHYRALLGLAFRWWNPGITHYPVGSRKHRYWAASQDPPRYGGALTDAEAVALCFPISTRQQRRNLVLESWRVLSDLVAASEVRHVNGHFLPPAKLPHTPRHGALRRMLKRRRKP